MGWRRQRTVARRASHRQSIGSKMIKKYIKGAHAVVLAYDLTDYQSFADLEDWMALVVQAFAVPDAPSAAGADAVAHAVAEGGSVSGEAAVGASARAPAGISHHTVGGAVVAAKLPHMVLMANKMDLAHQRAVKVAKHKQFVADHCIAADYFVSAKSGDYVTPSFTKVAAALAGVTLERSDVLAATRVIEAQIVNHQANDPEVEEKPGGSSGSRCAIQ